MDCACGKKCDEGAKSKKDKVREIIEKEPSKATGALAAELNMSEMEVIRSLPDDMVKEASKERFDDVIREVSQWGALTVIVSNESTILEVKAPFPIGTYGHGYYNLKSNDSPVGGHIKIDDLEAIFFVSKPFMGLESHSIQFFNKNGNAMFKLYLGRDENRKILPEQLNKFMALKERL